MSTIGDRILSLRKDKKLSQNTLANMAGISDAYVGKLEKNNANATAKVLDNIANALDTTVNYLMYGKEKPEPITENEHNKEIINNEGIRRIERARNKMPLKEKEKMMKILKASFEDYFDEED